MSIIIGTLASAVLPALIDAFKAPPDTPPEKVEEAAQEAAQNAAQAVEQQVQLMAADAAAADKFRSWNRPFIMWVLGVAIASDLIVRPYLFAFAGKALPALPADVLWPLIFGLVGMGGLRTAEKYGGVADSAGKIAGALLGGVAKRVGK